MKKLYVLLVCTVLCINTFATHNNCGEITYTNLSGLTYKIRVVTYTNAEPNTTEADRCELTVRFGDGDNAIAPRVNGASTMLCPPNGDGELIGSFIKKNIYEITHTYSAYGLFTISIEDPNRSVGICNIPNSVNQPFYLESTLAIEPSIGSTNSPQFIAPPIFSAIAGSTYTQNVTAYDLDGDMLRYELVPCKGAGGQSIIGYSYPAGLSVDSINGEIKWNAPTLICKYNFAVKVKKWRNGIMVGYVIRDFQVNCISDYDSCNFSGNTNWNINSNGEYAYAIAAGDSIQLNLNFSATGSNFNLEAFSDAFFPANPALFSKTTSADTVYSMFKWNTNSSNARPSPYIITFRGSFGTTSKYQKDVTLMICVFDNFSTPCFAYTGVKKDPKNAQKILLYPNPTSDKIFISKLNNETGSTLFVFDITGRLIKNVCLTGSSPEIEVADLRDGFYTYEIFSNKLSIAKGKFVKN